VTEIPCPVCADRTRDGLLCSTCTARLRATLRNLPGLMRELQVTLTRQDQALKGGGRGNGETPLPFNVNASEVAHTVTNTVGTWIRTIDVRAVIRPRTVRRCHCRAPLAPCDMTVALPVTMTDWCVWLLEHMPAIRRHRDVEQMYDELTYAAKIVWRAIDRPADREFVQQCAICGHGVYAAPGADVAPCQRCRAVAERDDDGKVIGFVPEYDVAAAHLTRVATLRAALLVPADLRTAVEAISGIPVSIKLVRSWVNRGRLLAKTSVDGQPLYSVEDALALAARVPTPARRRVIRRVNA
jgi:hypothetical protein